MFLCFSLTKGGVIRSQFHGGSVCANSRMTSRPLMQRISRIVVPCPPKGVKLCSCFFFDVQLVHTVFLAHRNHRPSSLSLDQTIPHRWARLVQAHRLVERCSLQRHPTASIVSCCVFAEHLPISSAHQCIDL